MKKILIVITIIFLCSNAVIAGSKGSAGDFLKIGNGARHAAMGEATSAIVDDIEALNINIARLSLLKKIMVFYEHTELYQKIRYESVSFGLPLTLFANKLEAVLGININYMYSSKFEGYRKGKSIGMVSFSSYKIILGYGMKLFGGKIIRLDGGVNVSVIGKKVYEKSKINPSLDFALSTTLLGSKLRKIFADGITVSAVFQNIYFGSSGENNNLPICLRIGIGTSIFSKGIHKMNFGMDMIKYFSNSLKYNLGLEYWLKNLVAFRIGGKIGGDQLGYFSAGIGFKIDIGGKNIQLDYAIQPYTDMGIRHHISGKFDFGLKKKKSDKKNDKVEILYNEGVNHMVNKRYLEAKKVFNKVLKENPEHSDAKNKIKEIENILINEEKIIKKE